MNPQVSPGLIAVISQFSGADAGGNAKPLSNLTATLDDTSDCYIALNTFNALVLVQKTAQGVGQTKTVNITYNAMSENGTPLSPLVQPFDLVGPAPPPQATQIIIGSVNVRDTIGVNVPADPGSPTVQII